MDHNKIDDVKETSQTCDTSFEVGGDPFTFVRFRALLKKVKTLIMVIQMNTLYVLM